MNSIYEAYAGQVVPIAIHMNWPDRADPFYLWNPEDAEGRRAFYGIPEIPAFRWDGHQIQDPANFATFAEWYAFVWDALDSLLTIPSPVRIEVDHYKTTDSVYVSCDIVAADTLTGSQRVYLVVSKTWVHTSGQDTCYHPMRDYIPDPDSGEIITLVSPGDSTHFDWTYEIPDGGTDSDRLANNVFVQAVTGNKIVQGWGEPVPDIDTHVDVGHAPFRFVLDQNIPNPFNPTTTIPYHVDRSGPVRLLVYAPTGRLVADLVDGPVVEGSYSVVWDGRDRFGREVGSGVYYCVLRANDSRSTRKMVLVR